jgi:hypothetical protein
VFSPEEDAELAEYFLSAARTRFPAPVEAARKMAYEFALRKGKQVSASWSTTRMVIIIYTAKCGHLASSPRN